MIIFWSQGRLAFLLIRTPQMTISSRHGRLSPPAVGRTCRLTSANLSCWNILKQTDISFEMFCLGVCNLMQRCKTLYTKAIATCKFEVVKCLRLVFFFFAWSSLFVWHLVYISTYVCLTVPISVMTTLLPYCLTK